MHDAKIKAKLNRCSTISLGKARPFYSVTYKCYIYWHFGILHFAIVGIPHTDWLILPHKMIRYDYDDNMIYEIIWWINVSLSLSHDS